MKKYVNIAIITFNRLEYTQKCIGSVLKYTDYPHVITVIDNYSQDGTRDFLKDLKTKGLIKNLVLLDENIGVAKASNIAWLLEPSSEYYLKLDNDIVIQKSPWLTPMAETIESIPVLGAVAYNFEQASYPLQTINGHRVRLKHGNLGGACILISKRTEKLLGYWCEDYGLYGQEDLDYGIRIQLIGLLNAYMEDEQTVINMGMDDDKEYTQWKNDQFEKSNNYTKIANNVYGFFKGSRSFYYQAIFAENYLSLKESASINNIRTALNKIHSLINSKNYDEAIEEIENLLQTYPGFAFLHNYLKSLYQVKGNGTKAAYHHEQAKLVNPYIHEVPPNLADFYARVMK
ncbi:MAG: glycosyltransferase [Thermodesulfovibrionales bacterium]